MTRAARPSRNSPVNSPPPRIEAKQPDVPGCRGGGHLQRLCDGHRQAKDGPHRSPDDFRVVRLDPERPEDDSAAAQRVRRPQQRAHVGRVPQVGQNQHRRRTGEDCLQIAAPGPGHGDDSGRSRQIGELLGARRVDEVDRRSTGLDFPNQRCRFVRLRSHEELFDCKRAGMRFLKQGWPFEGEPLLVGASLGGAKLANARQPRRMGADGRSHLRCFP